MKTAPCVIIPAFNEEKKIGPVLEEACATGLDIVVIDDGSGDCTADVAEQAGALVIRHGVNRGKGAAIRTAISYVLDQNYPAALFMDADGQHLPSEIHGFVKAFQATGADIVLGSRMHDNRTMPLVRKLSNRFSSFLVSMVARRRITDSQSGFRLLSARFLESLAMRGGAGFDFESEMLIDAAREGYTYAEVPISCVYGDEKSHYHPFSDSAGFLALILRKLVK